LWSSNCPVVLYVSAFSNNDLCHLLSILIPPNLAVQVYQLLVQFPHHFEFSERLLIDMVDAVYSEWFGVCLIASLVRSTVALLALILLASSGVCLGGVSLTLCASVSLCECVMGLVYSVRGFLCPIYVGSMNVPPCTRQAHFCATLRRRKIYMGCAKQRSASGSMFATTERSGCN
jgi:hypothetical protein